MKWLSKLRQRFFPRVYVTLEHNVPGQSWLTRVVFNVPFKAVPALGEVIKFHGLHWKITKVGAYPNGTPRLVMEWSYPDGMPRRM